MISDRCKIVQPIAVLSKTRTGWTKELNLISWDDRPAKYDLRTWGPEHSSMGKGITLTEEELRKLPAVIGGLNLEEK